MVGIFLASASDLRTFHLGFLLFTAMVVVYVDPDYLLEGVTFMRGILYLGIVVLLVASVGQPAMGQAQQQTVHFDVPFDGLPFVTCLGETVSCNGLQRVTARQLIDGSGAIHFTTQVRDLGVTCTGDDSGTTFFWQSNETEATRLGLPCEEGGCISFVNFTNHFISPGSADNLIVNIRVKQLITPSGQLDVFVVGLSSQCTG
jgi:hypothetical protein